MPEDALTADAEWWKRKLLRMDDRTFALPKWGTQVFNVLLLTAEGRIDGENLRDLSRKFAVPLKFLPRAVASVTRLGIVTAHLRSPLMWVLIDRQALRRRKVGLHRPRVPLSPADRESLKAQSDYRCACCGDRFAPRDLVLDHLIPLSLLGADVRENLVAMARHHNAKKWDRLIRGNLRLYRQEPVNKPFGVRFIDGAFFPVVNGKLRYSRRAQTP